MKVRAQMIAQGPGTTTIPEGGIPVVQLVEHPENYLSTPEVAQAVNFLRCGCPLVQLKLRDDTKRDAWSILLDVIQEKFTALELPNEKFTFESKPEVFLVTIGRTGRT